MLSGTCIEEQSDEVISKLLTFGYEIAALRSQ